MPHPTGRGLPFKAKLAIWSAILVVVAVSVLELILFSNTPASLEIFAFGFVGLIIFWFGGPLVVWFVLWWLSNVTDWWDTEDKSEDDG